MRRLVRRRVRFASELAEEVRPDSNRRRPFAWRRIEELVKAPVVLLCPIPDRDDTITMWRPFAGRTGRA